MRFIKRIITAHKSTLRKFYVLLKSVGKQVDMYIVRALSLGSFFRPSRVPGVEGDIKEQVRILHELDVRSFQVYNKATNPPITIKVYNRCKALLRKILGRAKHLAKKVLA